MEQQANIQPQAQPSGKGKKIAIIGLGLIGLGTATFFGWRWNKARKAKKELEQNTEAASDSASPPEKLSFNLPVSPPRRNDDFPLKKGSLGSRVKQVQEVLLVKLGKDALGKSGADGDFGARTEAALSKMNYPISIDENSFNVIVHGDSAVQDKDSLAKEIYLALSKKDFTGVLRALQKIKSVTDYSAVSEILKNNYRIGGVRQTLVNGALSSFSDDKQKQAIRLQFTRMGLNYDGNKWTLSGLETSALITNKACTIWSPCGKEIKVPANMVLGKEVARRGEHTLFENNGRHFLVTTKTINYL